MLEHPTHCRTKSPPASHSTRPSDSRSIVCSGLAHVLLHCFRHSSSSSSSEYSSSESRLKSEDLNSSRLRVLKCLLDDQNSRSVSVPDNRYAVSNGSGYAVLISWTEYAVLDRELDTSYPVEVDTPYSTVDQNSVFKKNN
ncbi:hypothetical protein Tco_1117150 [Tanacetum coccineum]